MAKLKSILREFLQSEAFRGHLQLAAARLPAAQRLKETIAAFLRGDAGLAVLCEALRGAVGEQLAWGTEQRPLWGFGGPGTARFVEALERVAEPVELELELRKALAGIDPADPTEKLRAFAGFVTRLAQQAAGGTEPNLHVGYATCLLSFCWHILYDQEVPVFYGGSHKAIKELIADGTIVEPGYLSRDLGERFRAFLHICRGLRELLQRVNPRLGFWTVEAFFDWVVARQLAAPGADSALVSARLPQLGEAALLGASPSAAAGSPAAAAGAVSGARAAAGSGSGGMPHVVATVLADMPRTAVDEDEGARTIEQGIARGGAAVLPEDAGPPAAAPAAELPPAVPPVADATASAARVAAAAPAAPRVDSPEALAEQLLLAPELVASMWAVLRERGRLLITGPPGVGKTHVACALARAFAADAGRAHLLAIHPAVRHEHLVEGEREPGGAVRDGVLTLVAERARRAPPAARFVVVLDELGVVDPAAVLGEWAVLLQHRAESVVLARSQRPFTLPPNLYLIATDSGDGSRLGRQVLRRLFPAVALAPDAELLRRFLQQQSPEVVWVADVFAALNARLVEDLGPGRVLGHGLFMRSGLDEAGLERLWAHEVLPLVAAELDDPTRLERYRLQALRTEAGAGGLPVAAPG
ncbi:MAG: hypothetical protein KatS3mg102_1993 [Planctomycetota bacterium]|nr:MAG: hypothetical protein KatS3mg102_1993 [Planctomycetota bacterium]